MPKSYTLGYWDLDVDGFRDLLDQAETNAKSGREAEFVEGLRAHFEDFEANTYLSEKQYDWLRSIAGDKE